MRPVAYVLDETGGLQERGTEARTVSAAQEQWGGGRAVERGASRTDACLRANGVVLRWLCATVRVQRDVETPATKPTTAENTRRQERKEATTVIAIEPAISLNSLITRRHSAPAAPRLRCSPSALASLIPPPLDE